MCSLVKERQDLQTHLDRSRERNGSLERISMIRSEVSSSVCLLNLIDLLLVSSSMYLLFLIDLLVILSKCPILILDPQLKSLSMITRKTKDLLFHMAITWAGLVKS
ncbi:hypothetical protein FRX31_017487 [Thalictrum thalictroides]|uniref:Uncharacterized protein n=1 Tax=Thalictrum thalictroides TaxID=46969 RepID=A0A7J6W961_THATH|nr:hypothetical protein FRX31_017487 [Thalictrum thalictroides]